MGTCYTAGCCIAPSFWWPRAMPRSSKLVSLVQVLSFYYHCSPHLFPIEGAICCHLHHSWLLYCPIIVLAEEKENFRGICLQTCTTLSIHALLYFCNHCSSHLPPIIALPFMAPYATICFTVHFPFIVMANKKLDEYHCHGSTS